MSKAADSLAHKLEEFGKALEPPEQEALEAVMKLYSEAVEERIAAVETLAPEDEKELEPIRAALDAPKQEPHDMMITVTTVTTALASSRWLCSKK